MTWADCIPIRTYINKIGGSLFLHCQQRSKVCSRTYTWAAAFSFC